MIRIHYRNSINEYILCIRHFDTTNRMSQYTTTDNTYIFYTVN